MHPHQSTHPAKHRSTKPPTSTHSNPSIYLFICPVRLLASHSAKLLGGEKTLKCFSLDELSEPSKGETLCCRISQLEKSETWLDNQSFFMLSIHVTFLYTQLSPAVIPADKAKIKYAWDLNGLKFNDGFGKTWLSPWLIVTKMGLAFKRFVLRLISRL